MHRVTAHSNYLSCLCRIASVTSVTVVLSFTEDNAKLISSVKLICYWFSQAFLLCRVAHEKPTRRLVDQRGRRSRTLCRKLNKCKCKVLTG